MLKNMRTSPEGCLSDYRRDKLIAGELSPDDRRAANAHLATCARCAGLVNEARAEAARFAAEPPSWQQIRAAAAASPAAGRAAVPDLAGPRKPPLPKRLQRSSPVFLGLIAAFLIVIVVRRPVDDPAGTRLKGNARVGFFVKRGETTWAGRAGDAVRPGDAVQFVYTSQAPSFLAILSADAGGRVEILYPDGPRAARAPAGGDVVLPQSTVLDDIIGHERVLALFCEQPVEIEPVRRAWQATSGVGAPPIPAGCHADFTGWEKRAP